jgi:Kelch motif
MSRRTAIVGLVVSSFLLLLTLVTVSGAVHLPGPHVRAMLGFEPPEPSECEFDPSQILEPPGKPGPGTWRLEHDSPTPAPESAAVAIGPYVYTVGGQRPDHSEPQVFRFDTRTGEYRAEPEPPVAIDHAVVAKHDGEVILASGYIDGETATNRMWAYSPKARRWRELPSMPHARGAAAGATVGDKLYVAGGVYEYGYTDRPYRLLEIYNFKTHRWTQGPKMPTARHHFGVGVVDGKLYFAGGRRPNDLNLNAFEEFDPTTSRWHVLPPVPTGTGSPAVAAVDGKVVVAGGGTEVVANPAEGTILRAAYAYDPATRHWSRLPNMRRARHGAPAAAVGERVYVFRGVPCPGYGTMSSVESLRVR